jgi:predicted transcriptional regulator
MAIKRENRKIPPEKKARERAIREKYQRDKPGLQQLRASGEYIGPITQGTYFAVQVLAKHLREARERQNLSLTEVSKRTGIDKGALSRLETGAAGNPTLETLERYAQAVGKRLMLGLEDRAVGRS